ncbi:putative DNA binding protein [Candidatus Nitrososphaera evergladensis SR1]|jgi:DNA-binding CsgD family transcriptional regulator|uniref:Putative DNA binding protein n=1 Tax=Candidatus Nitrososphaera evergladensis SR1 TaxID=1459636 RepID=A0A075MUD4_9ARCH|nr:helix-turn-helix domain-containing protein [Candidatus Nitrososphaera evergladensis]AIF84718.1 putative DNA binding protein [Candidatus Nitrososphaera evergladensis SR1]
MRRVTLEFNYQDAWKQIFGSNYGKVEVLEALRCFRCDTQGLALICRIRLKDKSMDVKDLVGNGLLTNLEVLYREKDGSLVVFLEGETVVPQSPGNLYRPRLLMARPPEFLDVNRMKAELVGKETEIKKFLQYTNKLSSTYKILGLTSVDTKAESPLSKLTLKQRQTLLMAFALGYYDVPRRISSEELSRHLNADKSTVVEHLRKAERKLIDGIIAG